MSPAANDFVHLHVHSEYSLLDGANRLGPMVNHVKGMGQEAIALTDHGVLFGTLEFYEKATKAGVKPIVGCEVYITPTDRKARGAEEKKNTHHLLLLAENYEGYKNLCKLSSVGFTEGFYYKPRIDFETLSKYSDNLIATSSCLAGLIPQQLLVDNEQKAAEYCGQFVDIFGEEKFFIEMQDHDLREQHHVNGGLLEIAKKQNLRLIATNDSHYMTKQDAEMHDCLLCIQTGSRISDKNRMRFTTQEFYLKSTEEMFKLFSDIPEAITNTRLVSEMCNFVMPEREYRIPKFPTPDNMSEMDFLRSEVWKGAEKRYGEKIDGPLKERIEFELSVIEEMGYPGYFLIVADFISHARSQGIPVGPGRGSAAGSVVAYCMEITQLCPLEHGLLFERFLNPARLSMPDIDIDFCFERRSDVIEYVRKKYGEECVSQIITFGTLKAKAAVRDVGRAMSIDLGTVDKVAKAIPNDLKMTLPKAVDESKDLQQLMEGDPEIARLIDMAKRVEGMVRHASTHAAGIIIADQDITEYAPLYKPPAEDRPATQYTMTECEESLGLLKMDFLGIKNLTIISRVEKWLKARKDIEIDWTKIPMDDPQTYKVLQAGQTQGVFQLESDGMTNLVRRLKPSEFADLTALLAIYRPGPLGAGMHDMYVERKHGRQEVIYDHPVMEPILKETYGVILYQEQVMRISQDLCGFSKGDADILRKAMGKKKKDVMDKMEKQFIDGAEKEHGVPREKSQKIWNDIVTFAGYGFNKSHSAAYAVVTFQTAYLRAHYPTFFIAALLTNEIGGSTDNIEKYVKNANENGVEVLPVNINHSQEIFNPDGDRVWYALNGVKAVGTGFAKAVRKEREENGPFKSLQDLCMRLKKEDLNSRQLEALIKTGAFDELHPNRGSLLKALPGILDYAAEYHRSKNNAMDDLFVGAEGDDNSMVEEITLPNTADWDDRDKALFEKEFLGFYFTSHPLKKYEIELRSFSSMNSSEIRKRAETMEDKERVAVTIVGCILDVRVLTTKNGDPWAVVSLEDMNGSIEFKLWPRDYEKYHKDLELDSVIQVRGFLEIYAGRPSIVGNEVMNGTELRTQARALILEWPASSVTQNAVFELSELCKKYSGTKQICVRIRSEKEHYVDFFNLQSTRISITPDSLQELQKLPGNPKVKLLPPKKYAASKEPQVARS